VTGWSLWAQATPGVASAGLEWWRVLLGVVLLVSLLAALAVIVRKGGLGAFTRSRHAAITIDSVVPLGDRRSLMIVSVEGRRLLLGASPVNVSLVAELGPKPAFESALAQSVARSPEASR
jgi:flagellar biogenesis protein FliO